MNGEKNWSSYGNSYLRYLSSLDRPGNSMTMFTLSEQELQSALEAVKEYVIRTNSGKAKIVIQAGKISISTENSRGMWC